MPPPVPRSRGPIALDLVVGNVKPPHVSKFTGKPFNWFWLPEQSQDRPPNWEHPEHR